VNSVGVDVDSANLVCKIKRNGKEYPISIFTNDAKGHRQFIKWATKRGQPARVCLEATGVYSLPFSLALHQAREVEVMVVNPKAIKNFAVASMQRGKTDALDAGVILEYLERMTFKTWEPPSDELLELQHISHRISQLNKELTRERNRHKAAERLGALGRVVANDTSVVMRHLQKRIEMLNQEMLVIIESDPELSRKYRLLCSVTGVADKTGPRILAELACLPEEMKGPQWVAHTGLDPRPYESGTSTNRPRRITKAGNKYLREALFFPALVAIRHDNHVKAFYEKLLSRGKKPLQAIVAVMRKLLLAFWGMFKNNETWEGEKFYKMA